MELFFFIRKMMKNKRSSSDRGRLRKTSFIMELFLFFSKNLNYSSKFGKIWKRSEAPLTEADPSVVTESESLSINVSLSFDKKEAFFWCSYFFFKKSKITWARRYLFGNYLSLVLWINSKPYNNEFEMYDNDDWFLVHIVDNIEYHWWYRILLEHCWLYRLLLMIKNVVDHIEYWLYALLMDEMSGKCEKILLLQPQWDEEKNASIATKCVNVEIKYSPI